MVDGALGQATSPARSVSGDYTLTCRRHEVFELLCEGLSHKKAPEAGASASAGGPRIC